MTVYAEGRVKLHRGIVLWDSVTTPEIQEQGSNAGKPKWSIKVAFPPGHPEVAEFTAAAEEKLLTSEFKGILPSGGRMPVNTATAAEYEGMFNGWAVVSFKSQYAPKVFDENNAELAPQQYAALFYTGQTVDILGHCYSINAGGNRGVSAGLDGVGIIASAQSPVLKLGKGGYDVGSAFGGPPPAPAQAVPPQGYSAPAPAQVVPPQGYAAPAPAQVVPPQGYAAPTQAHNYLPGQ